MIFSVVELYSIITDLLRKSRALSVPASPSGVAGTTVVHRLVIPLDVVPVIRAEVRTESIAAVRGNLGPAVFALGVVFVVCHDSIITL